MVKKSVGTAEGSGIHECTHESHQGVPFVTDSTAAYNEHMKLPGHFDVNGQDECGRCGTIVRYEKRPTGTKVFCDSCKEALKKELFS